MTLKEILDKENLSNVEIMERITYPKEMQEELGEEDTLFGYCEYKDGELIPLDGDSYSLDDEFYKYELNDNELTVWEMGEFING